MDEADVWRDAMRVSLSNTPSTKFKRTEGAKAEGKKSGAKKGLLAFTIASLFNMGSTFYLSDFDRAIAMAPHVSLIHDLDRDMSGGLVPLITKRDDVAVHDVTQEGFGLGQETHCCTEWALMTLLTTENAAVRGSSFT